MANMDGVQLSIVWRTMPRESKLELTETMAGMLKGLRERKLCYICGLYSRPSSCRTDTYENTQDSEALLTTSAEGAGECHDDDVSTPEFHVGRIHDPVFFMASRLYLSGSRGPY